LLTTREGILPYWEGRPDLLRRPPAATELSRLKRLAKIPREVVIDDRLFHRFRPEANKLVCADLLRKDGQTDLVVLKRPGDDFFAGQLQAMNAFADLRDDRLDEIMVQQEDITSFFASVLGLESGRSAWIFELMEAVVRLCGYVEFPLKFHFDVPRPAHFCTRTMPVIETPGHGSWPSGHATEAFALATVLAGLLHRQVDAPGTFSMQVASGPCASPAHVLKRVAMRIADNRVVAGVHYPFDSVAGAVLGTAIGEALVNYLSGAEATSAYVLEEPKGLTAGNGDLTLDTLEDLLGLSAAIPVAFAEAPHQRDALLKAVWAEAVTCMTASAPAPAPGPTAAPG
ncbi:MAG: phosphatase PAP2 family protein, partial [Cereibacter changlensis]